MKLIVEKDKLNITPELFMRQAGYTYLRDRHTGKDSFARRAGSNFYPRFHVYINEGDEKIVFNLHLDQKKPSYQGARAHSAEYEGEAVEREMERLKGLIA